MTQRLGLHLVWGCYGFWLPNDPRGSWSRYVGGRRLYDAGGGATTVSTRRSLAKDHHDRRLRTLTKAQLADPPVRLSGTQAREAALGVAAAAGELGLAVWAMCVMPDHVHLVCPESGHDAKLLIGRLKSFATRRVNAAGPELRPGRTPWVRGGWFVSLATKADVRRAIAYVNANPPRDGLPPQRWSFVRAFEDQPCAR